MGADQNNPQMGPSSSTGANAFEGEWERHWSPRLLELCDRIRSATLEALAAALKSGDMSAVATAKAEGAGDTTYGLDLPSEALIEAWFESEASRHPLSVLTEDSGWRHGAPDPAGGWKKLDGFDHGGPRIAFDPVDGTRNLMTNLRSAWTVVSFAGPGKDQPRFVDVWAGIVAELPDSRAGQWRRLSATRNSPCLLEVFTRDGAVELERRELVVDQDDRADHGYFPFFRYMPDLRPAIAQLEAAFFERLQRLEGADVRNCYDDQYITSAGHFVLLSLGTYRMLVEPRAFLAQRRGRPTVPTKPYDMAGAMVCALAAGCEITSPTGEEIDFPIDTQTPVSYVGYANSATRRRLEPHWLAVVEDTKGP